MVKPASWTVVEIRLGLRTITSVSMKSTARRRISAQRSASAAFGDGFGRLSATVAAQIARYQEAVRKGDPVSLDEAVSVFRLAGRRPDAQLVFADAGRRAARHAARSGPVLGRAAAKMAPGGLGRSMGEGVAARSARRVLNMEMKSVDGGAEATMARPLSITALPDGSGCTFYGSALAELLRVLTGFEGAMVHTTCRGRGEPACVWRATAVGGYE